MSCLKVLLTFAKQENREELQPQEPEQKWLTAEVTRRAVRFLNPVAFCSLSASYQVLPLFFPLTFLLLLFIPSLCLLILYSFSMPSSPLAPRRCCST